MDGPLCAAIAQEMRVMRKLVDDLAAVLVADQRFIADYLDQLQSFDLIVQLIDEGAALLDQMAQGQDPRAAVNKVRLTAMQQRLCVALY